MKVIITLVKNSGTIYKDDLGYQLGLRCLKILEERNERNDITERMITGNERRINVHFFHGLINNLKGGERADYEGSDSKVLLLRNILVIAHMSTTNEGERLVGSRRLSGRLS